MHINITMVITTDARLLLLLPVLIKVSCGGRCHLLIVDIRLNVRCECLLLDQVTVVMRLGAWAASCV